MDPDIEYVNPEGAIEPGTRRGIAEFSAAVNKTYEPGSTGAPSPRSCARSATTWWRC